jgi:hypothetical protein
LRTKSLSIIILVHVAGVLDHHQVVWYAVNHNAVTCRSLSSIYGIIHIDLWWRLLLPFVYPIKSTTPLLLCTAFSLSVPLQALLCCSALPSLCLSLYEYYFSAALHCLLSVYPVTSSIPLLLCTAFSLSVPLQVLLLCRSGLPSVCLSHYKSLCPTLGPTSVTLSCNVQQQSPYITFDHAAVLLMSTALLVLFFILNKKCVIVRVCRWSPFNTHIVRLWCRVGLWRPGGGVHGCWSAELHSRFRSLLSRLDSSWLRTTNEWLSSKHDTAKVCFYKGMNRRVENWYLYRLCLYCSWGVLETLQAIAWIQILSVTFLLTSLSFLLASLTLWHTNFFGELGGTNRFIT